MLSICITISLLPMSPINSDCMVQRMFRRPCFLILLFLIALPAAALGQSLDEVSAATRTFAIENTRVVQKPGLVLTNATVVIRDGLILSVGTNVSVPFDAERIAGDSLTVYAGFIDGLSHVGIPTPKTDNNNSQGEEKVSRANPPNDRAGIQPEREAAALLNTEHGSIAALRKAGFTAAHVVPRGRMLPGKGAVVLLAGEKPEEMILKRNTSMFAQLTGARGVYPATPMGVMAKMRQLYRESMRRKNMEAMYASNASGMPRPAFDASHYAFFPVIDGELPIFMHTTSPLDIYRALRLKDTLGYPLVLSGLYGGFEYVDLLLDADVPLFLTLKMPKDLPKDKDKKEETKEPAPYDPSMHVTNHTDTETERINLVARQKIFHEEYLATAATLYDAGLNFGFTTKDVKTSDIHKNIRLMVGKGLPEDAALAALTTQPASSLGLSRSMGSVEAGKIANLVITTGPLFEEKSKIKYVFVDGLKFEYDVKEAPKKSNGETVNPAGTWSFTIEGAGISGVMTLTGDPDNLSGTIEADGQPTMTIENAEIEGDLLTFNFDAGEIGNVSASLTIDEDTLEGIFEVPQMGPSPVTGQKTSDPEYYR